VTIITDLLEDWCVNDLTNTCVLRGSCVFVPAAAIVVSIGAFPPVPARHCVVAGTDRAQRSEDHLSDHGLQQLAKRLLCSLGNRGRFELWQRMIDQCVGERGMNDAESGQPPPLPKLDRSVENRWINNWQSQYAYRTLNKHDDLWLNRFQALADQYDARIENRSQQRKSDPPKVANIDNIPFNARGEGPHSFNRRCKAKSRLVPRMTISRRCCPMF
jgi:hypothetical protein